MSTVDEKYKKLFDLLEKRDSSKYEDKCLLVKKSICRNLKLFLELSEENSKLHCLLDTECYFTLKEYKKYENLQHKLSTLKSKLESNNFTVAELLEVIGE
jgi:predicted transcriptional regulator